MIINASQNPAALANIKPTLDTDRSLSECRPTTTANMIIPNTSSTTAAAITVNPSAESSWRNSASTRAVIPIDVAVRIVPTNSIGLIDLIELKSPKPIQ